MDMLMMTMMEEMMTMVNYQVKKHKTDNFSASYAGRRNNLSKWTNILLAY